MMEKVFRYKKLFRVMGWITGVLLLFMAAGSFVAAVQMTGFQTALPVARALPFVSGLIISSVNPLHFVFWTGWSTVLMNRQILKSGGWSYATYIGAISLGSMLGFACYIYGGNYLIMRWQSHQSLMNWSIGAVLLITAVIQFYKMLFGSWFRRDLWRLQIRNFIKNLNYGKVSTVSPPGGQTRQGKGSC
jgi:hypothetical protein